MAGTKRIPISRQYTPSITPLAVRLFTEMIGNARAVNIAISGGRCTLACTVSLVLGCGTGR